MLCGSQAQKNKYCLIPLTEIPRIVKVTEVENRTVVARGWQKGNGEMLLNQCEVWIMQEELVRSAKQRRAHSQQRCTVHLKFC
jgi:hypothetical protein